MAERSAVEECSTEETSGHFGVSLVAAYLAAALGWSAIHEGGALKYSSRNASLLHQRRRAMCLKKTYTSSERVHGLRQLRTCKESEIVRV